MRKWQQILILLMCMFMLPNLYAAPADNTTNLEHQVKAAYIYKFTSFVEWPDGIFANSTSPIVIGVAGEDGLFDALQRVVAGHTSNGHSINVRKLGPRDSVQGLHVLFLGQQNKALVSELLAACHGNAILTVTDAADTYALGSMVNFLMSEDKLRFEVALKPVGISRLKISARMLSAAFKVSPAS